MERAWDDDDLPDYGPVTQGEHRKAEVAKFKNTKKSKQLVKQNRHRWQSFNERLDGVQVDVLRRTGRDSQRGNKSLLDEGFDEDFGSHFEAQVAKWAELNLTADFTEFLHVVQCFRRNEGIAPHPAVAYKLFNLQDQAKEHSKRAQGSPARRTSSRRSKNSRGRGALRGWCSRRGW